MSGCRIAISSAGETNTSPLTATPTSRGRLRAMAAIEHKGARRPLARGLGQVGNGKNRGGRLAFLIGQANRLGNRTVFERMTAQCDLVLRLDERGRLAGSSRGFIVGNGRGSQPSCGEPATDKDNRSTSC